MSEKIKFKCSEGLSAKYSVKHKEIKEFFQSQGYGMFEIFFTNGQSMFFEYLEDDNDLTWILRRYHNTDSFEVIKFEKFVPQKTIQYFK